MFKYHIEGTYDGFSVDETVASEEKAIQICKDHKLNPLIAISKVSSDIKNDYICKFCGMYSATKPRCNKCELEDLT